jgi:hypothetical protein
MANHAGVTWNDDAKRMHERMKTRIKRKREKRNAKQQWGQSRMWNFNEIATHIQRSNFAFAIRVPGGAGLAIISRTA